MPIVIPNLKNSTDHGKIKCRICVNYYQIQLANVPLKAKKNEVFAETTPPVKMQEQ